MTKEPLDKLFDAMYHGKISFDDFLNSPVENNFKLLVNKKRKIYESSENLKIFHKFLSLFLFDQLPINESVVFSYRRGFGVVDAVEKHSKQKFFFQTDINNFFGSLDESLIRKVIEEGASNSQISDVNRYIDRIIDLVIVEDSLPVGFSSSAPLSNAALVHFDNEMNAYCEAEDMIYTRYADDIIISCCKKNKLAGIDDFVQRKLHEFASSKLVINREKTKFFQVGERVSMLGVMILPNGKISSDTKKRRELEVMIHFYLTSEKKLIDLVSAKKSKPGREIVLSLEECLDVVGGSLNYVNSIDPDFTDKLRRKFGVAVIDMLMYRGFSSKS